MRWKKLISERYENPCDDCIYYPMYNGLNDWLRITFRPSRDSDKDELVEAQEWTLQQIGERTSAQIAIDNYGAYLVDDRMKYYLVRWTSMPWKVEGESLDTACGFARAGDMVSKGVWMNPVQRAQRWFWEPANEVVVRCQYILCSDVELSNHG
jgi:hypothetical protein